MERPSQAKPKKENPKDQQRILTEKAANDALTPAKAIAPPASVTLLHTLKGHTAYVFSVEWSPDGKLLASCSGEQTILWDLVAGTPLHTLKGHASSFDVVLERVLNAYKLLLMS